MNSILANYAVRCEIAKREPRCVWLSFSYILLSQFVANHIVEVADNNHVNAVENVFNVNVVVNWSNELVE